MKKQTPKEIAEKYRQNGNSTWILRSAIENPECIIVAYDNTCAQGLKDEYFYMLENSHWLKKLKWEIYGRKHPVFLSLKDDLSNYKLPIIFDNSSMY